MFVCVCVSNRISKLFFSIEQVLIQFLHPTNFNPKSSLFLFASIVRPSNPVSCAMVCEIRKKWAEFRRKGGNAGGERKWKFSSKRPAETRSNLEREKNNVSSQLLPVCKASNSIILLLLSLSLSLFLSLSLSLFLSPHTCTLSKKVTSSAEVLLRTRSHLINGGQ